eukprot:TRINITY_DN5547_c0_g1_i1.p1 TRINITY_DN5547_c0_g1~~TRINITY_DN5547_c0_g1_i1.p1  ORF type:complete len:935 (+),score=271.87 TRINITY_DN5547_c0_g1_i1:16-2820(+)
MDFLKKITEKFQKPEVKPQVQEKKDLVKEHKVKKRSTDEVMQSLDKRFNEENMSIKDYLLESMPKDEKIHSWIDKQLENSQESLDVISDQLNDKVMSNYDSFVKAMLQIQELQDDLSNTTLICKYGRQNLALLRDNFVKSGMELLASYRKKSNYKTVLDNLLIMKGIMDNVKNLKTLMERENFPRVVEQSKECLIDLENHKELYCLSTLKGTIAKISETLVEKLNIMLENCCRTFHGNNYHKVLLTYYKLQTTYGVVSLFKDYFSNLINNNVHNFVFTYCSQQKNTKNVKLKDMQLKNLALHLGQEQILPCLLTVFEYLVDQMNVQYQMINWHSDFEKNPVAYVDTSEYGFLTKNELEKREKEAKRAMEDFRDTRRGIESYKASVWDEMQRKIGFLLAAPSLLHSKIDGFLKVLEAVNKFITIGRSFADTDTFYLEGSVKKVSKAFFRNYHKQRIEDLTTMLENQLWQKVPLPSSNYSVRSIHEFKEFLDDMDNTANNSTPNVSSYSNTSTNPNEQNFFVNFAKDGNPFSKPKLTEEKKHNEIENIEELNEIEKQLEQDQILEEGEINKNNTKRKIDLKGPILTSTTINITKYLAKYFQMMKILSPIAPEIFDASIQLFDFYLYSVYDFFAKSPKIETKLMSPNLRITLKRIKEQLLEGGNTNMNTSNVEQLNSLKTSARMPTLSKMISINLSEDLNGISYKACAVESLMFLADSMKIVKPHLKRLLLNKDHPSFKNFYEHSVDVCEELGQLIYDCASDYFFNYDDIINNILKVNWSKIASFDPNTYVNILINNFKQFKVTLIKIINREGTIKIATSTTLWVNTITKVMNTLVEGYSRVKKCSSDGRTLMLLDFKHFQTELDKISEMKHIPAAEYVVGYIKALLDQNSLKQWIQVHYPQYSLNQLVSLVNLSDLARRDRSNLIQEIENLKKDSV